WEAAMSEETPEIEPTESEEKPKRRRRRKASGAGSTAERSAETSPSPEPRAEGRKRGGRRAGSRVAQAENEAPAAAEDQEAAGEARLVCDHIRGKSVEEARAILAHTPRAIARDWSRLLESAVANAEHNHELIGEDLYVKVVRADEGPTIKRYRPRALGRATRIRKRTSHLTILLTPKE